MGKFFIDAYAWIEYFIATEKGGKAREIIDDERNEIFTAAVTIAEVVSVTKREGGDAESAYNYIMLNSKAVSASAEICKNAGMVHAEVRNSNKDFGLADAFVLSEARRLKAKILTGDEHFRRFEEAVLI